VSLRDPVYPAYVASYDPKLRVFVNQETYFFSSNDTKKRFLSDPVRYSGPLTDPVTQKRFRPTPRSPRAKYQDRLFYFESPVTQRQFAAAPKDFARRREN